MVRDIMNEELERIVVEDRDKMIVSIPQLWKEDLMLAERYSEDVLDVTEFVSKNSPEFTAHVVSMAKCISDALVINIEEAKSIRKRYFQKILAPDNIMRKLTPKQMTTLFDLIMKLERTPTKKAEGKELDDNSQNGSLEEPSPQSESEEPKDFQSELTEQQ